jgi:glucose/arabinose dehydrogenase
MRWPKFAESEAEPRGIDRAVCLLPLPFPPRIPAFRPRNESVVDLHRLDFDIGEWEMSKFTRIALLTSVAVAASVGLTSLVARPNAARKVNTGQSAFTSYQTESPGTFRKITVTDLPKPFATKSAGNGPTVVPRPEGAWPKTVEGFKVDLYAKDLDDPREIRKAPNGDLFVAQTSSGKVTVFRGMDGDGHPKQASTFATGLREPFGIQFYPAGDNPKWVYVANTNSVVRFPYTSGDLEATGKSETIVSELPSGGGHITRDLAFSQDGQKLFVSVGSASNVDAPPSPREKHRANVLQYTPDGKFVKIYASGIRNPVGLAIQPETGILWCSVNERDELGDNLVPDYVSTVKEDAFYGWPWYYMGDHQDPRHPGAHPELKGKVTVPDVLIQPHSASLQLTFYEGKQFPSEYHGQIFAAEHGSWNRATRAGYEVIRVVLKDGKPTGEYEDFVTGFVTPDGKVWGRPVGVAVGDDGSLFVSDDGSHSIWRVSYTK